MNTEEVADATALEEWISRVCDAVTKMGQK